jgi:hypothetical protein
MSDRKHIEASLDRSLQRGIRAPRLDRRFDAAVWARIEAEESKATNPGRAATPRVLRATRWLAISNYVGVAATLAVVAWFVARTFGGIEIPAGIGLDLQVPAISDETLTTTINVLGQVLGYAALAFGLSFTSLGRRVRGAFS